jgi:hypothetical protein
MSITAAKNAIIVIAFSDRPQTHDVRAFDSQSSSVEALQLCTALCSLAVVYTGVWRVSFNVRIV